MVLLRPLLDHAVAQIHQFINMPKISDRQAIIDHLMKPLKAKAYCFVIEDVVSHLDDVLSSLVPTAVALPVSRTSSESCSDSGSGESESEEDKEQAEDTEPLNMMLMEVLEEVEKRRYLIARGSITKSSINLDICLKEHKFSRPDLFRKTSRMWPTTFDRLVEELHDEDVFYNIKGPAQMPVDRQL